MIAWACAHLTGCGSDGAGPTDLSASAGGRGRIAGFVWDDADGNGQWSQGDGPLPDVRVYLDINGNRVRDPGERATTTDALGGYRFDELAAGDYDVRLEVPFGFRNTVGGDGAPAPPIVGGSAPRANIIGGAEATGEAYPFLVMVGANLGDSFLRICGGSLISDRWVVTAAHCTEGLQIELASVLVGTGDVSGGSGQILAVKALHIHPGYARRRGESTGEPVSVLAGFDIALWELAKPIPLAESQLSTVEMLRAGTDLDATGTLATAVGWGTSDLGSDLLQQVHLPIFDPGACHGVYSDAVHFETQLCAGVPEGGIDACQGDSGGPLLVRSRDRMEWRLSGVTSYGNGCARPGYPGVYARVSALSDWVERTAREPSRVHRVAVRNGRTALASFGIQTTLRPHIQRISPRWQLTTFTATANDDGLHLSFGILDEANRARGYECSFDLDGRGPAPPRRLACRAGTNEADIPGATSGVFLAELEVSLAGESGASFKRSKPLIVGAPPEVKVRGGLTLDDTTDPDREHMFVMDEYDLGELAGDRALSVSVRSAEFAPFVRLLDRDLLGAGGPDDTIALFPDAVRDEGGFVSAMAFFPRPGVHYVVRVSHKVIGEIGSYTLSAVNDGFPVATALRAQSAASARRSIKSDARVSAASVSLSRSHDLGPAAR